MNDSPQTPTEQLPARYGWGDGRSPAAAGPAAFEAPPEQGVAVRTEAGYSRRRRRTSAQEMGFVAQNAAGYGGTPPAAIDVEPA